VELRPPLRSLETRRADLVGQAPLGEKAAWCVFQAALAVCRARYVAERIWVERLGGAAGPSWPAIDETKELEGAG
jgi:hypothetical protein